MRSRTNAAVPLLLALLTTSLAAQDRPDFSGSWTAATQPTSGSRGSASGGPGSGWGQAFSIRQDDDTLTVERAFFTRPDLQPALKLRYSLDGTEIRNEILMGRGIQELVTTAMWNDKELVLTTELEFPDPESDRLLTTRVTRTLSLERPPPGRDAWPPSLVIETTRDGVAGGPASTTRTVYTRD